MRCFRQANNNFDSRGLCKCEEGDSGDATLSTCLFAAWARATPRFVSCRHRISHARVTTTVASAPAIFARVGHHTKVSARWLSRLLWKHNNFALTLRGGAYIDTGVCLHDTLDPGERELCKAGERLEAAIGKIQVSDGEFLHRGGGRESSIWALTSSIHEVGCSV